MKAYLLLFAIITTMSCGAQPLSSRIDTLCLPVSAVQNMVIAAQQKKELEREMVIAEKRIETLLQAIREHEKKDTVTAGIIDTYKREVQAIREEMAIYDKELKTVNKSLRKQKRKTFWTAMAGVVSTGAAILFFK